MKTTSAGKAASAGVGGRPAGPARKKPSVTRESDSNIYRLAWLAIPLDELPPEEQQTDDTLPNAASTAADLDWLTEKRQGSPELRSAPRDEPSRDLLEVQYAASRARMLQEGPQNFPNMVASNEELAERYRPPQVKVDLVAINTARYIAVQMKVATVAFAKVADAHGLTVAELNEAIDNYTAAKAAARENTARGAEPSRPVAAVSASRAIDLEWPSEKWKGSPEHLSRKQRAIFPFLRRVWKPFIEETGAVVTRQMLRDSDHNAEIALSGALRSCDMPDDIRIIPTRELKKTVGRQPIILMTHD